MKMLNKMSILKVDDLSVEDILKVMETADSFTDISKREVKKVPTLRGKTVVNLFFEPSTRTKTSFEVAAKRLSADMINFAASSSSLKKGESIMDTLRTILAMQVDLIVIRHSDSGTVKLVDNFVEVPVINAGDGKHQHPTQALLDLYTIRSRFEKFEGLKVAVAGDFLNSRVARSDITPVNPMILCPCSLSSTAEYVLSTPPLKPMIQSYSLFFCAALISAITTFNFCSPSSFIIHDIS